MKQMIVAVLVQMLNNRGSIKDIKMQLLCQFRDKLLADKDDKSEWEQTFLKTLSRYKNIFLKSAAVFHLQQDITLMDASYLNLEEDEGDSSAEHPQPEEAA